MQGKFQLVFPEAPESFDQAILRVLQEGRDARPVRHIGRRLLIAACLLLLLSAVCYAVVKGFGILDLLRDRGGVRPSGEAAQLVQPLPEQTGGQFDGAHLTMEEALTDGRQIYFTARFELEKPGGAVLLGDGESANGQAEAGGKTFAQRAKEAGCPLLRAEITNIQIGGEDVEDIEGVDMVRDGDGLVYAYRVPCDASGGAPLQLTLSTALTDVLNQGEDRTQRRELTAQVRATSRATAYTWDGPLTLSGFGCEIRSVRLTLTPVVTYADVEYAPLPGATFAQLQGISNMHLVFGGEDGCAIASGLGGETEYEGDVRLQHDILPAFEALPDVLLLGPWDDDEEKFYESVRLSTADAEKEETHEARGALDAPSDPVAGSRREGGTNSLPFGGRFRVFQRERRVGSLRGRSSSDGLLRRRFDHHRPALLVGGLHSGLLHRPQRQGTLAARRGG
jgi:hypothetical protein